MNMLNSARKLFGYVLAAMMLGAFALPASATFVDEFRFVVSPTAISAGPGQTITAKITNRAPFDYLKSFTITLPAGVTIPVSPKPTSPTISASKISVNGAGNVITVSGVAIAYNASAVLTMSATYTSSDSCVPKPLTWVPTAKGGLFVDYEVFKLDAGNSTVTQTLAAASCSMAFVNTPQDIVSPGQLGSGANPVSVQGSPAAAFSGKSITLSASGATLSGTTNPATANASGLAIFPGLTATGLVGPYSLIATASGSSPASAPFKIGTAAEILDCEGQPNGLPNGFSGSSGGIAVVGSRGINKDGSICKLTKFDLAIRTDGSVGFTWNTELQPNGAFTYEIKWKPEFVAADGLPVRTQVAWTLKPDLTPDYKTGRFCLSPDLPKQYGTLTYAINSTESAITITSTGPATLPTTPVGLVFPLVIGTERMAAVVTATAGQYTVTRGAGATPQAAHLAGAAVMSTPFPLDAVAAQMRMCLADETVQVLTSDSCSPSDPSKACVGVTTQIDDAGDGYTSRN